LFQLYALFFQAAGKMKASSRTMQRISGCLLAVCMLLLPLVYFVAYDCTRWLPPSGWTGEKVIECSKGEREARKKLTPACLLPACRPAAAL
jgi:hypothetical protein